MEGQWENGPFGVYHRNCYQTYTAKNLLERVAKKRKIENFSIADNRNSAAFELRADSRSTRSSLLVTDMKKCAICQSEKTDGKDRRRKEKLTLCETMQTGTTLLKAAKFRGDERLIVALSGQDPIAIELSYHRTCYRSYTNAKQIEVIEKNQEMYILLRMKLSKLGTSWFNVQAMHSVKWPLTRPSSRPSTEIQNRKAEL